MISTEPTALIPVTLLTGFLGSGKTTVLNHVLKQPGMAATAVIVNEFGEIGLDHLLVERSSEDVVLLNSGCLCCTMRGDIVDTLTNLFVDRVKGKVPFFTRVAIETTGLADPAPILHTLPGLWTGAPRRCSGGGLRRNAARALAIMPCTVPTSEVWTPPAPGAGIRGVRMPAGVRAPAHTARC